MLLSVVSTIKTNKATFLSLKVMWWFNNKHHQNTITKKIILPMINKIIPQNPDIIKQTTDKMLMKAMTQKE